MSNSPLDLLRMGVMQSGGGAAPYVEQGITANGTQKLDFGDFAGPDNAQSLMFFSGTPDDLRACIGHWASANSTGQWLTDETTGGGVLDPSGKYVLDASSPASLFTNAGLDVGRVHIFWSTEVSGSDILIRWAVWSSATGWLTGSSVRPNATVIEFTTQGDDLTLLSKRNDSIPYFGDIYRFALWIGASANVHLTATRDLFVSGVNTVDPAISLASLGDANRVFDAYGDKDVWDSGNFPKGSFTKTGDPFVNV